MGGRKDSATYVKMKERKATECGFKSVKEDLPEDTTEETLLGIVSELNRDPTIDGILVQLPLPDHIDQKTVLEAISIGKDVDGFHPHNVGSLVRCGEVLRQRKEAFHGIANAPCTPLGCLELIDRVGLDLSGKHVVILGRSNIVGLPAAVMCLHKNATVVMCHSRTQDIKSECLRADVIIAAIGQPEFVKGDWIKEGATVIDVGVNFKEDASRKSGQRMCGKYDISSSVKKWIYQTVLCVEVLVTLLNGLFFLFVPCSCLQVMLITKPPLNEPAPSLQYRVVWVQ